MNRHLGSRAEPDTEPAAARLSPQESVYNRSLLLAFVANVFQLTAVSLLFRYSDFVTVLGGTEWNLGWIVGIASIGAIGFRLIQGAAVDRFGPAVVWIVSIVGEIVALYWHLQIDSISGLEVYLARTLFTLSLAGNFGAWLSFISLQAPQERVAEVIGVVGASGFVGMAVGPAIGDYLFAGTAEVTRGQVEMMFLVSIGMLVGALATALMACSFAKRNKTLQETNRSKTILNPVTVIRRNHPGFILAVGALMGLTIGFPGTFLRPMAESMDIEQLKTFFIVYNVVAFVSRLIFRRAPQTLGLRNAILLGFSFMGLSILLYLPMKSSAGFWAPAILGGMAHSFLFPSVIAACTNAFPSNQRGIAMNLILAMYDLGVLIGMPIIGFIVTRSRDAGVAPYPTALLFVFAVIVAVSSTFYVLESRRTRRATETARAPRC